MDNQHRKITGYRELSQAEIDLMNRIKAKGEELKSLIDDVNASHADDATQEALTKAAESYRWAAIAKTHMQEGLMALTRAVAKPQSF